MPRPPVPEFAAAVNPVEPVPMLAPRVADAALKAPELPAMLVDANAEVGRTKE